MTLRTPNRRNENVRGIILKRPFQQTYRERSTGAVPGSMCLNLLEGEMDTKKKTREKGIPGSGNTIQ
jgi:hypothetical protein